MPSFISFFEMPSIMNLASLQAFTLKSDGLRQLFETSESALATNMDDYFVNGVWFLGGLLTLIGAVVLVFMAIVTILCLRRKRLQRATAQQPQSMAMRPQPPPQNATTNQGQPKQQHLQAAPPVDYEGSYTSVASPRRTDFQKPDLIEQKEYPGMT